MDKRPIGVFDSGLGGLCAVSALHALMPEEDIVYFGDTARLPYGTRSRETILRYARDDIALLRRFDVKCILAACGTVSSTVLDEIKSESDIPLLGVVDSAVIRAAAGNPAKIGVLGTGATIASGVFERKLREKCPGAEVRCVACPLFVSLVENGVTSGGIASLIAEQYLLPMREFAPQKLILGCTHFPLLRSVIASVLPEGTELIDPGKEVAPALMECLAARGLQNERDRTGTVRFLVSDDPKGFSEKALLFLGEAFSPSAEQVSL